MRFTNPTSSCRRFDAENEGAVSVEEMRFIMSSLPVEMDAIELDEMMRSCALLTGISATSATGIRAMSATGIRLKSATIRISSRRIIVAFEHRRKIN